jgi:RNA recognition motif-containing protein
LGVDVTDDVLFKAFSAYPSMQRARVVFDKRSGRTKGYGFVSFKDPEDYRKAMREMNGKYVGSRPVKLRKSTWKDRDLSSRTMKKIKKGVIKPY